MKTLREVIKNPTGFDSMNNYIGDMPDADMYVLLTRSRDSDTLTESNWDVAFKRLGGEETEDVKIYRFGHWACGWWEALCVREGSKECDVANEIEDSLNDYPILDEEDHSERENQEAEYIWKNCYNENERIKYIRDHQYQFEFQNMKDMIACVRGKYFAGYAS